MSIPVGTKRGTYMRRADYITAIMQVVRFQVWTSATEVMKSLNVEKRFVFVNRYVIPALKDGLLEMVVPNMPEFRNQQFKKTQLAAIQFGC